MSVLIKVLEMPPNCSECAFCGYYGYGAHMCDIIEKAVEYESAKTSRLDDCPLIPVPKHGRLIDADALRAKLYHEAFETDTPMQKWDSGCWIRYKLFEMTEESAPTIIPAEEDE